MTLYLVRHGEAMSEEQNPLRPLSEKGSRDVKKVAAFAAARGAAAVTTIYHSGKLRAEETAKLLAERLTPDSTSVVTNGLSPMDEPRVWYDRVSEMRDDIMLVGHLPYLGRLLSLLLKTGTGQNAFEFQAGGAACVRRTGDKEWRLEWAVNPGDIA